MANSCGGQNLANVAENATVAKQSGAWLTALLALFFFFSGFSALVYQVTWQRMLGLFLGVDVFAVTVVVAAFMIGLGAGSGFGGCIADRVPSTRLIPLFAIAELFVAAFGLISKTLFYNWLPLQCANSMDSCFSLLIPCALLVLPTFCMGLTLPLLSKALVTDTDNAGVKIGLLYGVNTLGAAVGAIFTTIILIRYLGIPASLQVAAILNIVSFFGALMIVLGRSRVSTISNEQSLQPIDSGISKINGYLFIYCLSGFIALSLELIWFRLLGVMLKSNSFTFSWLLCLYLAGIGIGTIMGIVWVRSSKQAFGDFLGLQSGISLYSGLSLVVLLQLFSRWSWFAPAKQYLGSYEPMGRITLSHPEPAFVMLYLIAAGLLILPPTVMMGMSFPYLQRAVQTDVGHLGQRIGWLQVANITGATVGTVLIGIFAFGTIGSSSALKLICLCGGVFAFLWWYHRSKFQIRNVRAIGFVLCLALITVTVSLIPNNVQLWASLHGVSPHQIIVNESAAGISVLTSDDGKFEGKINVFVNGLGQAFLPFGVTLIHTQLGMLPVFLHPNPVDVAIIGLGSGDTLFGAAGRDKVKSIDCIEIISSELDSLKDLRKRDVCKQLDSILNDSRIHYHFEDGRRFVSDKSRKYDVIEADALRPRSAYANNIYSTEYFTLIKNHLKPHGLAVTWAPTERTYQTFVRVFPYTVEFACVLVGSNEPIELNQELLKQRAQEQFSVSHFGQADIDSVSCLYEIAKYARRVPCKERPLSGIGLNSDLFPRDELGTPQSQ